MAEGSGKIRVAVSGAAGRMGRMVVETVVAQADMMLVATIDRVGTGEPLADVAGVGVPTMKIDSGIENALDRERPDVVVDFTVPASAKANALACIERGASPVVGTTGLSAMDLEEISRACERQSVPAMVVPNFAVGAVLMMRFAEEAAKWLPQVEIIEMHHDKKADSPSGTAMLTAEKIGNARGESAAIPRTETFKVQGVRGGIHAGVPIHSVRLQGLLAHQIVMLGGPGEVLSIRHDSMDRGSFMAGVMLAVRRVRHLKGLTIGLDSVLFEGA